MIKKQKSLRESKNVSKINKDEENKSSVGETSGSEETKKTFTTDWNIIITSSIIN